MDELVASARDHWAPRFTANGVPFPEVDRLLRTIESWPQWCGEWSSAAASHEALGLEAGAAGRTLSAAEHFATAAAMYHFAKFVFVVDPAQMRQAHLAAVRCYDAAIASLPRPGRKIRIPFDGAALTAVFRSPQGVRPFPAVVLIPGLDSAKEELRATEELFLDRGMATFTVDGPGQGESEYDLPLRGDWEVPGRAIIDELERMPGVDADRIGVWGVSLGGYYAPRMASGEPRIKACIALSGPYDWGELWDRLPQLTRDTFSYRSRSADESQARTAASRLSLAGLASKITCPMLIVSGKKDRLIPWEHQLRLHEETKHTSELLLLEEGNHGCTNLVAAHRYRAADWMAGKLGGFVDSAQGHP